MNKITILIYFSLFFDYSSYCNAAIFVDPNDPKVPLKEICSFNIIQYKDCYLYNGNYLPAANIPRGLVKYENRVFLSFPRADGVPATLAYFDTNEIVNGFCPKLSPYPSLQLNSLSHEHESKQLVSVQRFSIDQCKNDKKLWLFDTGSIGSHKIKGPGLIVISLKTDTVIRYRALPKDFYSLNSVQGFSKLVVNVVCDDCSKAYAYIVNHLQGTLTVYSYHEDCFWQFSTTLFKINAYPDSLFQVKTLNNTEAKYELDIGLWDVSPDNHNKVLLFSARASKHVFTIPYETIHNKSSSILSPDKYGMKYLGHYNTRGNPGSFSLVPEFQTVFVVQEQNYAVACWDYQKKLDPASVKLVSGNRIFTPFLADMFVDRSHNDLNLVTLSINLAGIVFDDFYDTFLNFRIYTFNVKEALAVYPECTSVYKPDCQKSHMSYERVGTPTFSTTYKKIMY
uniref:CSON013702 protein n=1 Tax=Culicoides sonorensis TaxID=179676 RepID=A0A336LHM9_CULSO